jgi:FAD dependent oxidoreductase TIGR03364
MFDDGIVGAGILGLAHAYQLAKRGRRVIVFERAPRAMGASIRNFGMLWPIGQPAGPMRRLALRSLTIWSELLEAAGLWHERAGSLHLAYREDEAQVLQEFTRAAADREIDCEFLNAPQVLARSSAVKPDGLIVGMASPTETCVDPREVIARLPEWLGREHGVRFDFGTAVTDYERPKIRAGGQEWRASHLYLCAGDDTETLFPELLRNAGLVRCKLQMMRSQPLDGWRLGPMLAGGLTLRHYAAFQNCPTLPALKRRVAEEMPEYDRYGIHVMASQNGRGEIVIGDSHEYGNAMDPFDNPEIDALILRYLETFLQAPELRIAARWHGIYAKHPTEPYTVARASASAHPRVACQPAPGVTVITGVGGAGMTLSFGLAEQVVRENLGEA